MLLFFEYVFISYKVPMGLTGKQIFKSSLRCLTFIFFKLYFHTIVFKTLFNPQTHGFVCLSWGVSWREVGQDKEVFSQGYR